MPTGYTAGVADGKIATLRDFAWACARGMGALITMRDDPHDAPVPEQFKPSTSYHDDILSTVRDILGSVPHLSADECDRRAKFDFDTEMESHLRYAREKNEQRARYRDMICKVEAWKPDDEVLSLKEFMLSQLKDSVEFDCPERPSYEPKPPVRLTGEKWREQILEKASRDLAYHATERDKEIQRTAGRNKWLKALRASLT